MGVDRGVQLVLHHVRFQKHASSCESDVKLPESSKDQIRKIDGIAAGRKQPHCRRRRHVKTSRVEWLSTAGREQRE